jgi:hypothetical protein
MSSVGRQGRDGARLRRVGVTCALLAIWYLSIAVVNRYVVGRFDLNDYASGAHMGSYPLQFWYVILWGAAVLAPGIVLPFVWSVHRGSTTHLVIAIAAPVAVALAICALTAFSTCQMGDIPSEDTVVTLLTAGMLIALPLALAHDLARRRGIIGSAATSIAVVVAITMGFLGMLLFGSCDGLSHQVTRGVDAPLYAIMAMALTAPAAFVGGWLGGRGAVQRPGRQPPHREHGP